jgi:putative transposase
MPKSYIKIAIHAIWATKNREPIITPKIEPILHDFMRKHFEELGCPLSIVNGMPDHVHCLFYLSREHSIAQVIKHIKGSSSFYINKQELVEDTFAWQNGYAAYSVSDSVFLKVYQYIKNQKQHHLSKSFDVEFEDFVKLVE